MDFLKRLLKKDEAIQSYAEFWAWFQAHEQHFFHVVKHGKNIETQLFDPLTLTLKALNHRFFYLVGMLDDTTAELVFTADGQVKKIAFIEDLVAAAPTLDVWKFTALKPAISIKDINIEMAGYQFNKETLSFYAHESTNFPDEINLSIIHEDFREDNKGVITNGTFIFLDNLLGELNFVTLIDSVEIIGTKDAQKPLVPIEKLESFLTWRQKEFIEKYEGTKYNTEENQHAIFKAMSKNDRPIVAVINTDLLAWDGKASHPWIATMKISYDGSGRDGLPDDATMELMDNLEDEIIEELKDFEGYLNVGRQTGEHTRTLYFACKDFRKPSKVLYAFQQLYKEKLATNFEMYKDKYWRTFAPFSKRY